MAMNLFYCVRQHIPHFYYTIRENSPATSQLKRTDLKDLVREKEFVYYLYI